MYYVVLRILGKHGTTRNKENAEAMYCYEGVCETLIQAYHQGG